jgi:hypothetical protein
VLAVPIPALLAPFCSKLAFLTVGAAGMAAASRAAGWERVANFCEIMSTHGAVSHAMHGEPIDGVQHAVHRVTAALQKNMSLRDDDERVLARLVEILPRHLPSVRDIVSVDIDFDAIRNHLQRAIARAEPEDFAPDRRGGQILGQLLFNAFTVLGQDAHLAEQMRIPVAQETLQRLSRITAQLGQMEDAAERRHREVLEAIAREKGVDPKLLAPLFAHLGLELSPDEMRARAGEAIEALLDRARQPVAPSNERADIAATIGAVRAKLGRLDIAGADAILDNKIAEEEAARQQRLVPLLAERAAIKRLSFDYAAARDTLRQLIALDPSEPTVTQISPRSIQFQTFSGSRQHGVAAQSVGQPQQDR